MCEQAIVAILMPILIFGMIFGGVPLFFYILIPYAQSWSPEGRFERFVDVQCLQGNEIAIRIRREHGRCVSERDRKLVQEAIRGNPHAIKALKLLDEKKAQQ